MSRRGFFNAIAFGIVAWGLIAWGFWSCAR